MEEIVLQIQVAEIPEEGLQVDIKDHSWFPEGFSTRLDDLHARVFLSPRSGAILLFGQISLTLALECDRCLDELELPREIEFELSAVLGETDPALTVAEHECDRNEMDVIFLEEPVIDIGDILYQQVLLAVPQKVLCRKDCLGICSNCSANLNEEKCRCQLDNNGSPFNVLGLLLKEEE